MPESRKRDVSLLIPYTKKDGKLYVFLQKRTDDASKLPGYWAFFGGGLEIGERPEDALKREIKEEMDFIPENFRLFKKYEFDNGIKHVFILEVNENFDKNITINEGDGGKFLDKDGTISEVKISDEDRLVLNDVFESQF